MFLVKNNIGNFLFQCCINMGSLSGVSSSINVKSSDPYVSHEHNKERKTQKTDSLMGKITAFKLHFMLSHSAVFLGCIQTFSSDRVPCH